ncbi:hypothetical protein [Parachlamydia sp. AcF125]|uniref:hypothetical protein n=1 Tax=Parachlamydia sp. AcF125 TaxID=2795736 RepID=UPI001BCA3C9B|nr:hypothetical protein [Parachlamydia sp. AcF125]MBS4168618.1 hypothetical protein [Parachlamydia sp. AcF125]
MNVPFLNLSFQTQLNPYFLISPIPDHPSPSFPPDPALSQLKTHEFFPVLDEADQILGEMMLAGNTDQYGRLTEQFKAGLERGFFALDKPEFDKVCLALYKIIAQGSGKAAGYTIQHLLNECFDNPEIRVKYAGKDVRCHFLGKSYFCRLLNVLTKGQKKTWEQESQTELGDHAAQREIIELYFQSEELLERTYRSIAVRLASYPGKMFVESYQKRQIALRSAQGEIRCLLFFKSREALHLLESQVGIPLESFSACQINLPVMPNIYWPVTPIGEATEELEIEAQNDALQGLTDFLTKILHVNHFDNITDESFANLIALISEGRRDYGGGFRMASDVCMQKSLIWQFCNHYLSEKGRNAVERVTSAILEYQNKYEEHEIKMRLAMAYNVCWSIRHHVRSEELDQICLTLLANASYQNSLSIFSLIQEGILVWGLSFQEVMQVQQCFAILALGVKRPIFKYEKLSIVLTKHEGAPAIKIEEDGKTIFLSLEPCAGYHLCLELIARGSSSVTYLEKVFNAYFPLNAFNWNERSQLSDYAHYLSFLLTPLAEAIQFKGFEKHSFSFLLSYHLLAACQTSNPLTCGLELLLKKYAYAFEAEKDFLRKKLMGTQLVNLLIYSRCEPWASTARVMYDHFQSYCHSASPLVAWVWALIGIQSPRAYQLVTEIWKKDRTVLKQKESDYIPMIYKLIQLDVKCAFDLYRSLCSLPVEQLESRYQLFLDLTEALLEGRFPFLVEHLKISFSLFKERDLILHRARFRAQNNRIFSKIFEHLLAKQSYSFGCSFLFFLMEQKIWGPSDHFIWNNFFSRLVQIKDLPRAISFWEKGKKWGVWNQQNLPLILSLAENLFKDKGSTWNVEKNEILNFICSHSQKDSRITALVAEAIRGGGKRVTAMSVPFPSYYPYLSEKDQEEIFLNALQFEIDRGHYAQAADSLVKIFKFNRSIRQKFFRLFFSRVLGSPESLKNKKLADSLIKLLSLRAFAELFEEDKQEKVGWIFQIFQILAGETLIDQLTRPHLKLLGLLVREVFVKSYTEKSFEQALFCIETVLSFKSIPAELEKCLKTLNLNILEFCLQLPAKTIFAKIVQLMIAHQYLQPQSDIFLKKMNRWSLKFLKVSCDPEEILAFHSLWKEYTEKKGPTLFNPAIYEMLISRLLEVSQIPFALFWIKHFLGHFSEPSPAVIQICIQLACCLDLSSETEFYFLLKFFYEKKWKEQESRDLAWKILAEHCLRQKKLAPLYLLIEQCGHQVITDLMLHASELVRPFLLSACEDANDLNFYLQILAIGELNEPLYWLDLIEKINRNQSTAIQENFLKIFRQRVIEEDVLLQYPHEKAACLSNCLPLFEKDKTFDAYQWEQDPFLARFFSDKSLSRQKEDFYLYLYQHKSFLSPIRKRIKHPKIGKVYKGAQALLKRFEKEKICLQEEECLLILLERSHEAQHVNHRALIKEILKILHLYSSKRELQFVEPIAEACLTHPNMAIRRQFSALQDVLFCAKGAECYSIFQRWSKKITSWDESFTKPLFNLLESPLVLRVITQEQADQIIIEWITRLLQKKHVYAIELFYQHFLKFENFPNERRTCLANAAKNIFQNNRENPIKESTFIKCFNLMLYLWLKQTPYDGYLEYRKKLKKKERAYFLLDVLFDYHSSLANRNSEQLIKVEKVIPKPIPYFLDPPVFLRLFEFTDIFFSCFSAGDFPSLYYETFSYYLTRFTSLLWDLYPQNPYPHDPHIETYLQKVLFHLMEKLICFNHSRFPHSLEKVIGVIEENHYFQADVERFCKIYFYAQGAFPEKLSLSQAQVAGIVREAIKMLRNKPDEESSLKSILAFKNYSRTLVKESMENYFECLDWVLESANRHELFDEVTEVVFTPSVLLRPNGEIVIDASQSFFVFADGTKDGQELCLKVLDRFFNVLSSRNCSNELWDIKAFLLSKAIMKGIFAEQYEKFSPYLDSLGEETLKMCLRGDFELFNEFISLLFLDFYDSPPLKLSQREKILKLGKIKEWLKTFEKIFWEGEPLRNKKQNKILHRLQTEKKGKISEQELCRAENILIEAFIKLTLSKKSFPCFQRFELLRYFQDILLKRGEKGYDLILRCYRLFGDFLENEGLNMIDDKTEIFYFTQVLTGNPDFSVKMFEKTEKGKETVHRLFMETFNLWIYLFQKRGEWSSDEFLPYFEEAFVFLYHALQSGAFLERVEEGCYLFDQLLDIIKKMDFPILEETFLKKMTLISDYICWVMKVPTKREKNRALLESLFMKWTKIFMDKKALRHALKILVDKYHLKPEFQKGEIVGFIQLN